MESGFSSCPPSKTSRPTKTKPLTRAMAFAKHVTGSVTELTREVIPVVKAVNNEVSSELNSDLKRVREELTLQMSRPLPSRKNSSAPQ